MDERDAVDDALACLGRMDATEAVRDEALGDGEGAVCRPEPDGAVV